MNYDANVHKSYTMSIIAGFGGLKQKEQGQHSLTELI